MFKAALDLGTAMPEAERIGAIAEGVAGYGFGLIASLADEAAVHEFVAMTPIAAVFKEVRERARDVFGIAGS